MASDLARYEGNVSDFFGSLPRDLFVSTPCLFCPPTAPSVRLFTKGTLEIRRCQCGFIWSAMQPNDEALYRFYSTSRAMNDWSEIKDSEKEQERQKEKFGDAVDFLASAKVRSVLDVGCGNGVFLSMLKERVPGASLTGTELSPSAVAAASRRGLDVRPWDLTDALDRNPCTYDAITLWGVLEHVKNPLGVLRSAHSRLTPGGFLIVCVPNAKSLVVTTLWERCFTFCPQHLWYFDYETLSKALNASGLDAVYLTTIEPETLPTAKAMSGLPPYCPAPEWAYREIASEIKAPEVLADGLGYKIVAIAQSRVVAA